MPMVIEGMPDMTSRQKRKVGAMRLPSELTQVNAGENAERNTEAAGEENQSRCADDRVAYAAAGLAHRCR